MQRPASTQVSSLSVAPLGAALLLSWHPLCSCPCLETEHLSCARTALPLAPLICSLAGVQSINEDQHSTELELLEDPQHPVMKQPLVTRASGMQTQHQSFAQRAHHRQLGRRFERSTPTPRELKRLLGEAETWGFGGMMTFGER